MANVRAADGTTINAVTPETLKYYHDTYVVSDKIPYGDSNVKAALDDLIDKVNYVPFSIKSFTNNVGTVENGATVTDVTLSWTLAGNPTEVKLGNDAQPLDLAGSKVLSKQNITKNTTWTLTGKDAKNKSDSKTTGVYFKDKKYWGIGTASGNDINNDFVLGLTNALADNLKGDYTVTAGDGEYIYFAIPAAWSSMPSFWVGGFEGGFALAKTFDFTNASGATVSYNVFKSVNASLGNTTVTVK